MILYMVDKLALNSLHLTRGWPNMSPVGAIFVPFPPKTGKKLLHPRPPQSWNGSLQGVQRDVELVGSPIPSRTALALRSLQ